MVRHCCSHEDVVADPLPPTLILISRPIRILTKSVEVNWLPWTVLLNISSLSRFANALCGFNIKVGIGVIDAGQDSTHLVTQCSNGQLDEAPAPYECRCRWRRPGFGRLTGIFLSRYGSQLCAGAGFALFRLDAHAPHERSEMQPVHFEPLLNQKILQQPAAREVEFHVQLVDPVRHF